jgi:ABC-2 type transport system permease protein
MNPRRIAAVTRRIIAQFRRDRRTLALLFVVPLVITALLGWVVRDQKVSDTSLVVAAESPAVSSLLVTAIRANAGDSGVTVEAVADEAAARQALVDGNATVGLVVPAGFAAAGPAGQAMTVLIITPGVNPGSDSGHVAQVQRTLVATFATMAAGGRTLPTFERATVFGSPDADMLDAFAPVFIGFFVYFFVFLLTGVSFLRERVGGTLERLLATPITKGEVVAGYSIGFGIFATIQVLIVMTFALMRLDVPLVGSVGLDVPSAGNPAVAFVIALVLALGAVSLGIFLSTFARTELQVIQFIPVVIVPQVLLSGILWPVETLPDALRPLSHVLPLTYAVDGLRDVLIRGYGLGAASVQLDLGVLLGVAVLFVVLAAATIRREVA